MIDYHLKPSCSRNQAKYPGRSQTKDLYVLEPDWRLVHTNVMQSLVLWHPARNYQVEVYILSLILAVSVMLYMKFLWVDALIFFFAFFLKDHQLIGMWQRNRSYSNRIIFKYLWIFFFGEKSDVKTFPPHFTIFQFIRFALWNLSFCEKPQNCQTGFCLESFTMILRVSTIFFGQTL